MAVGDRIKSARLWRGMSLRELGTRLGKSQTAVSKFESGILPVSSSLLIRLSEELAVKPEYFLRTATPPTVKPCFRKRSSLGPKRERALLAAVSDWLERFMELLALIPSDSDLFDMPESFPRPVESMVDAEEAATALREAWDLGIDPIRNVTGLLENHGVVVLQLEAHEKFDACVFMVEHDGNTPVIVVRSDLPYDRQRFSLCHELAHLVIRPGESVHGERAANRFAGALLIPCEIAIQELGPTRQWLSDQELLILKRRYGVSMRAWVRRACDLGIITPAKYKTHEMHFSKRGWRGEEPGSERDPEMPQRFAQLITRAVAEGLITHRKASELMGYPYTEDLTRTPLDVGKIQVGLGT